MIAGKFCKRKHKFCRNCESSLWPMKSYPNLEGNLSGSFLWSEMSLSDNCWQPGVTTTTNTKIIIHSININITIKKGTKIYLRTTGGTLELVKPLAFSNLQDQASSSTFTFRSHSTPFSSSFLFSFSILLNWTNACLPLVFQVLVLMLGNLLLYLLTVFYLGRSI